MLVMAETSQLATGPHFAGSALYAWSAVFRDALVVKVEVQACVGGLGDGGGGEGGGGGGEGDGGGGEGGGGGGDGDGGGGLGGVLGEGGHGPHSRTALSFVTGQRPASQEHTLQVNLHQRKISGMWQ